MEPSVVGSNVGPDGIYRKKTHERETLLLLLVERKQLIPSSTVAASL